MTETAAAFLAICPDKHTDRCAQALQTILAAADGTPLYNVDYKDAKYWLDRAVEAAYRAKVSEPYLHGKGSNPQSDLDWHLGSLHNLNDAISRVKKLGKLKPTSQLNDCLFQDVDPEMVAAVREVLEAVQPVALLVKELRGSVVKGRKPTKPTKAKLEALEKEAAKRTCPCCFRAMQVKDGKMVRHGWKESGGRRQGEYGNAWHVGECFGVSYAPYEVSDLGTRKFLEYLEEIEKQEVASLERLNARPAEMSYSKRVRKDMRWVNEIVKVQDDGKPLKRSYSPETTYANVLLDAIYNKEQDLKFLRRDMATLRKAIEDWKPAA
jgi:hypothetical protein